jgi:hypothetical protein
MNEVGDAITCKVIKRFPVDGNNVTYRDRGLLSRRPGRSCHCESKPMNLEAACHEDSGDCSISGRRDSTELNRRRK